jgi:CRISPR type III-B/RAMP module-associated protein Cmr5
MTVIRKDFEKLKAKKAWDYKEAASSCADKYKSHVREFPMLVLTSGLLNAVAFAYEKGEVAGKDTEGDKGWKLIYKHTEDWFKNHTNILTIQEQGLLKCLLDVSDTDSHTIRVATNEVIALFTWLKRFVS